MADNEGEHTKIEWTHRRLPNGSVVKGYTWNGWQGCTKVSPACANCYAERDMTRYKAVVWGPAAAGGTRPKTTKDNWKKPERWAREAVEAGTRPLVFTASIADIGEEYDGPIIDNKGNALFRRPGSREEVPLPFLPAPDTPLPVGWHALLKARGDQDGLTLTTMDDLRVDLFRLMGKTAAALDWLALTKRPDVLLDRWPVLAAAWRDGCHGATMDPRDRDPGRQAALKRALRYYDATGLVPNVWAGTTVENQEFADRRLPFLSKIPTPRHFLSVEPQVGPVKLAGRTAEMKVVPEGQEGGLYSTWLNRPPDAPQSVGECWGVHWVISGGESGDKARPAHPDWYRHLRDESVRYGVPFHFKQHGEWIAVNDATPDMGEPDAVPTMSVFPDGNPRFTQADIAAVREGRLPLPVLNLRVGKKRAGRLLDDIEWHQTPRSVL